LPFTGVNNGKYSFKVSSVDALGNTSALSVCSNEMHVLSIGPTNATSLAWSPATPNPRNVATAATWNLSTDPNFASEALNFYSNAACTTNADAANTATAPNFLPASDGVYYFGVTTTDTAGNTSLACSPAMAFDFVKPTPTITQNTGQTDPTALLPIEFLVTWDEAIDQSTFTVSDIVDTSSTTSGITWTLTHVSGGTFFLAKATAISGGEGDVILTIAAGSVNGLSGNTSNASINTDNQVTYGLPKVVPTYSHAYQWNYYIKNDGAPGALQAYNATNTDCAPNTATSTDLGACETACLNLGYYNQFESSQSSCGALTAQDSLGAFDWICDDSSGAAIFYSTGLKTGKGLRDLVDFTNTEWLDNAVDVYSGAAVVESSISSKWWTNEVRDLPPNTATTQLTLADADGSVYLIPASASAGGYKMPGKKGYSFVGDSGVELSINSNTQLFSISNSLNFWFEIEGFNGANFGNNAFHAFSLNSVHNVVLAGNTNFKDLNNAAFRYLGNNLCFLGKLTDLGNTTLKSVLSLSGNSIHFKDEILLKNGNGVSGEYIDALSIEADNVLFDKDIEIDSYGRGILLKGKNIKAQNISSNNNADDGFYINSENTEILDIVANGNGYYGVYLDKAVNTVMGNVTVNNNGSTNNTGYSNGFDINYPEVLKVGNIISNDNQGVGLSMRGIPIAGSGVNDIILGNVSVERSWRGLSTYDLKGVEIGDVYVADSTSSGIVFYGVTDIVTKNIESRNNGDSGIEFEDVINFDQGSSNTLSINNGRKGLSFSGFGESILLGNVTSNENGQEGIYSVSESRRAELIRMKVVTTNDNEGHGIDFSGCDDCEVFSLTSNNNIKDGIQLESFNNFNYIDTAPITFAGNQGSISLYLGGVDGLTLPDIHCLDEIATCIWANTISNMKFGNIYSENYTYRSFDGSSFGDNIEIESITAFGGGIRFEGASLANPAENLKVGPILLAPPQNASTAPIRLFKFNVGFLDNAIFDSIVLHDMKRLQTASGWGFFAGGINHVTNSIFRSIKVFNQGLGEGIHMNNNLGTSIFQYLQGNSDDGLIYRDTTASTVGPVLSNVSALNSGGGFRTGTSGNIGSLTLNNILLAGTDENNLMSIFRGEISVNNAVLSHSNSENIRTSTLDAHLSGVLGLGDFGSANPCNIATSTGLDDPSCDPNASSDHTVVSMGNLSGVIVGQVSDTANSHGATGTFAYDDIRDWSSFENDFRGWGRYHASATFPDGANLADACATGETCQVWDYSLSASDTKILNKSGDLTNLNDPFVPGAACPSEVNGDEIVHSNDYLYDDATAGTHNIYLNGVLAGTAYTTRTACGAGQSCEQVYLRNATEMDPWTQVELGLSADLASASGDHDSLCEAGEICVYNPNIGAYQGHGALESCNFSASGGLSGISIYGWTQNGR